ncbi:helicase-related protein [Sphaerisporangium corydalis]|uniref:Helicase-related protein n=1 Tax=Sphaerisporangium corydalis TaxID=1441875 RepID=A0ABV9EJE0_9ACTN|nr:helicase-related protein [Sphaerisporangium corydalis]
MAEHADHYRFRSELVENLEKDLLGPVGGEREIIPDPPVTTYSTGILFPRREDRDDHEEEQSEKDADLAPARMAVEEIPDTGVSLANVQTPSSMGLTFAVDPTSSEIVTITVRAAVYEPIDSDGNLVKAQRIERRSTEKLNVRWRRRPLMIDPLKIDVTRHGPVTKEVASGLELRIRVRRPVANAVAVTATLVNVHEVGRGALRDSHCFFQPHLRIEGQTGIPLLVERPVPVGADEDEVLANKLLHRHAPTFAVGHGCAADWDWTPPPARGAVLQKVSPAAISALWSSFVPTYDVLLADSNPEFDVPTLDMLHLAEAPNDAVLSALGDLLSGYRAWITERSMEANELRDGEYSKVARQQIRLCEQVADRMAGGIALLGQNSEAMTAFRLANEAMAVQRGRTSWIKTRMEGDVGLTGRWRPFQIAFVLLCLESITDHDHPDRSIADLLWFPTGGGKTEAYLGLIAYTVFLRRLRKGEQGGGVTALMRYTLRLLTLQQFERAATLICAMELMRRNSIARLGTEQISLGMWVGRAATPNTLKVAAASIKKLRDGAELQEENPVQLRNCPWCGTKMSEWDYEVPDDLTTMSITCPAGNCDFHSGLPVHVVDQAVYKARPTLVIATVDKFAQIAWRADVAAIFNLDRTDGTPPPELIVQDELHLISGPLGTLTGLYETAIDIASNQPKIIASTATIRRAADQGRALFDRGVNQFPPAGLDSRDSWFAVEAPPDRKGSRLYVGLMTPSTSQATLLVRAYAALLHHALHVKGEDAVRDAYWTLIGYFNSLRLLAAAELQVNDDVQDRLKLLAERANVQARAADVQAELTSRVKSSDIPRRLKELELALPNDAFDTVLATNMISVGVDVDRLGLMAVMGQPQTTAEYIQATSRVGRRHPGLVVMLFNAARSRDRSHYESFVSYHSALYRQVESTSVTPFSARARDRGLHAVLIGLARLIHARARPNTAASDVEGFLTFLEELCNDILARVKGVAPEEVDATRKDLEEIIERWRDLAETNADLMYEAPYSFKRSMPRPNDAALLRSYSDEDLEDGFSTLWSLRDVDVESDLYLER